MSQEQAIPSPEELAEASEQVWPRTSPAIVEAIAVQMRLARLARARIEEEGFVVRDMRGSVIAHPAIKVEADAIKLYTDLIRKAKKR